MVPLTTVRAPLYCAYMNDPLKRIPFTRESWVALNLYAMATDGRQTLTLDGEAPCDYDPEGTISYIDAWESEPDVPWAGSLFYCIKANRPPPPDIVTSLIEALNERGRGRWLRIALHAVQEHTLVFWDSEQVPLFDGPHLCTCGLGTIATLDGVKCESGAQIFEAT